MDDSADAGFLSRWSRRKAQTRQAAAAAEVAEQAPPPAQSADPAEAHAPASALPGQTLATAAPAAKPPAAAAPPPTLDDVALLTRDSSYARFVAPGVPGTVRNAALRRLFTDPHFNVMDGLDIYIDDYGQPDPLPASWLRQMVQSKALGLFDDEEGSDARPAGAAAMTDIATDVATDGAADSATDVAAAAADADPGGFAREPLPTPNTDTPDDENADLRLQPDDAAGCEGAAQRAGGDAGRQR